MRANIEFQARPLWWLLFVVVLTITGSQQAQASEDRPTHQRSLKALVYQGKIVDPRGRTLKGKYNLKVEIVSPEPSYCLLWSEIQAIELVEGGFSVELGYEINRLPGDLGGAAEDFSQVFLNKAAFSNSNSKCAVGSSFSPGMVDDRLLYASFSQGTLEINVNALPIKAVPFALQALEVGGYRSSNLVRIQGAGSEVEFTPEEIQSFKNLLGGNILFNFQGRSLKNLADPIDPQDAATKSWVQSNLNATIVSAGLGTVSNVSVSGGALTVTNGSTVPQVSLAKATSTNHGYLSSEDWQSFNSRLEKVSLSDIQNSLGITQFPSACTSSQTLVWSAITDQLTCSDINGLNTNKITAGVFASSRLGGGVADSSTYLRGDGVWATIPPGADHLGNHSATQNINLNSFKIVSGAGSTGLSVDSSGRVGIGSVSPAVKLDVDGEIKIGNSSLACNAMNEGSLRYNSTTKRMEFCNGSVWSQISAGTVASVTIGAPSPSIVSGGSVVFPVTYGSGTDTATINLLAGSLSFGGSDISGCSVSGVASTGTYTRSVTVAGCTGTGAVSISVASGTASSTTGDPAPSAGPSTTFTADNTGPSAPTGMSLGTVPTSLSSSPTLSYSAAVDSGGSSVASHQARVTRVSDGALILDWTTHTSGSQLTGMSLSPSTNYAVTVRALDALGNVGSVSAAETWTTISGYAFTPTISSNTTNYNIRNQAIAAGWDQVIPLIVNLTINSGVTVYSTTPSTPALDTGTLTAGSTVTITNNGSILGGAVASGSGDKTLNQAWEGGSGLVLRAETTLNNAGLIIGGAGGGGASEGDACCGGGNGGSAGGQGGPAIVFNAAATVTNSGSIYGAGGGGAGGAGGWAAGVGAGYGGNGQGAYNGSVQSAVSGITSGICGGGFGGNGGTYGQPGANGGTCYSAAASGGAGGYAMVLNGQTVTYNSAPVSSNSSYVEGTWMSGTKGRIAP